MILHLSAVRQTSHITLSTPEINNCPHKNKTHKHNWVSTISMKIISTTILTIRFMTINTTRIKSQTTVTGSITNHTHNIPTKFTSMNKTSLIKIDNHQNLSLYPSLNLHPKKYKIMMNSPNLLIKTECPSKETKSSKDPQLTKTHYNNKIFKWINANKEASKETCQLESETKVFKEAFIPVASKLDKQMHWSNITNGAVDKILVNREKISMKVWTEVAPNQSKDLWAKSPKINLKLFRKFIFKNCNGKNEWMKELLINFIFHDLYFNFFISLTLFYFIKCP